MPGKLGLQSGVKSLIRWKNTLPAAIKDLANKGSSADISLFSHITCNQHMIWNNLWWNFLSNKLYVFFYLRKGERKTHYLDKMSYSIRYSSRKNIFITYVLTLFLIIFWDDKILKFQQNLLIFIFKSRYVHVVHVSKFIT